MEIWTCDKFAIERLPIFAASERRRKMHSRTNSTFVLSDPEIGVLSCVNVLFSVGGTIGNTLVIYAFFSYLNLRNNMNIFIVSLAFSDVWVCLVAQPMFVVSLIKNYQQESTSNSFESFRKVQTWISMLASAGNLLGVTLDRYFALSDPLLYPTRVNPNRSLLFVQIVWVVASVLGLLTEYFKEAKLVGQIYVFFMVACLIFPIYCRVLCIARKHARVIHAAYYRMASRNKNSPLSERARRLEIRKADRSSLQTVGIISSIFVIGWLPLLILPFVYRGKIHDRKITLQLFQWVNTLALCSSAWNPVVYSWRDRRFRSAFCRTYSRWVAKWVGSNQNRVRRITSNQNSVRREENPEKSIPMKTLGNCNNQSV